MSQGKVEARFEGERRREYMRSLLRDVRALDAMIHENVMETGVRRIGAEQEMFLVDRNHQPAPVVLDVLSRLNDSHFTTELAKFNLELNLDPSFFGGDCLSQMETQLQERLAQGAKAAAEIDVDIILTGILPTLRKSDLGLENMVPVPRYQAINQAMNELKGGAYEFYIKGLDELLIRHDSVMVESCNASFQVHFQSAAAEFPNLYNIAQVAAGPLMACATNSPMLFGRRLWSETRIALFQQSVDTRRPDDLRTMSARVTFGNRWVRESVLELYREDIARFRTLVGVESDEDPFDCLAKGVAPQLKALRLHNGTVYRWNRACYGITEGKPHLRIENRILPSGPSVVDEVANAAFWYGLVSALAFKYDDITKVIEFEHALQNFIAAAREGLGAQLTWLEREERPAPYLILEKLLPLAHEGLERGGIDAADRERYLGVVENRVRSGITGSRWQLHSLAAMRTQGTTGERLSALTAAILSRQKENTPVSEWKPANLHEAGGWKLNYMKVEQYMTTDIFSVREDDSVDLVANLMEWQRIRHVPVEDREHRLVGLVSYRTVLRLLAHGRLGVGAGPVAVSEIMKRDPVVVSPQLPTLKAIAVMRKYQIGCLPVVQDGRLVGIVTDHDFMDIAGELLEQKLKT